MPSLSLILEILAGVIRIFFPKKEKTATELEVQQNQKTFKDIADAQTIRDNPDKLDNSLLISPDQRGHNED